MKKQFLAREYRGLIIDKAGSNSSGIGYCARTGEGITLKAETLSDIKWMIKSYLFEKQTLKVQR